MLYQALRAAADVALHWYYADVVVQGATGSDGTVTAQSITQQPARGG